MNIRFRKKGSRSYYRVCRSAIKGAINYLEINLDRLRTDNGECLRKDEEIEESELILCYLNFEYKRLDEIVESKVCEK